LYRASYCESEATSQSNQQSVSRSTSAPAANSSSDVQLVCRSLGAGSRHRSIGKNRRRRLPVINRYLPPAPEHELRPTSCCDPKERIDADLFHEFVCWLVGLFVYSFVYIHSIHSFLRSFAHSFIHLLGRIACTDATTCLFTKLKFLVDVHHFCDQDLPANYKIFKKLSLLTKQCTCILSFDPSS